MKILESSSDRLVFNEPKRILGTFFGILFILGAVIIGLGSLFPDAIPNLKVSGGAGPVIGVIMFLLFGFIILLSSLSTLTVTLSKAEQNVLVATKSPFGTKSKSIPFKETQQVEFRTFRTNRQVSRAGGKSSYTRTEINYRLLLVLKDNTEVYITRTANVDWTLADLGKQVAKFINVPFVGVPGGTNVEE